MKHYTKIFWFFIFPVYTIPTILITFAYGLEVWPFILWGLLATAIGVGIMYFDELTNWPRHKKEKAQYKMLIERVKQINPDAAKYLAGPARKLPDFTPDGCLASIFEWERTPQGHEFWSRIDDHLTRT